MMPLRKRKSAKNTESVDRMVSPSASEAMSNVSDSIDGDVIEKPVEIAPAQPEKSLNEKILEYYAVLPLGPFNFEGLVEAVGASYREVSVAYHRLSGTGKIPTPQSIKE